MAKLSPNQEAMLEALHGVTTDRQVEFVGRRVWKLACAGKAHLNVGSMVKVGAVVAVKVIVSTNGKVTELYKPA